MFKCSRCSAKVRVPKEPFVTCENCHNSFHPRCASLYINYTTARECCKEKLGCLSEVINYKPKAVVKRSETVSPLLQNQLKLAQAALAEEESIDNESLSDVNVCVNDGVNDMTVKEAQISRLSLPISTQLSQDIVINMPITPTQSTLPDG